MSSIEPGAFGRLKAEDILIGQNQILEMIASGASMATSLKAIALFVESHSPEVICSVLLLDHTGKRLIFGAAPTLPDEYNREVDGILIGPKAGSCGTAAWRGEPVMVTDLATDPLWEDFRDLGLRHGLRACFSTPIWAGNHPIKTERKNLLGTFAVYSRKVGKPDDMLHKTPISTVTHLAAIAIQKHQADSALRSLNEELEIRVRNRTNELARLASIADASPDFIANIPLAQIGSPTWINSAMKALAQIRGISPEKIELSQFLSPRSYQEVTEKGIPTALKEGTWVGDTEVLGENGSLIPVSQVVLVHCDQEGKPQYLSTIMRDLTLRKRMEDELRDRSNALQIANSELAKASRHKDEFLANMSHELRTPLHGILALSEALEDGVYGPLVEKQTAVLSDIEKCGNHLLGLINDILDLAKVESGRLELELSPVNLNDIAEASQQLVKEIAKKKHQKLEISLKGITGLILADSKRLKQILVNLLMNAVKFTPDGGAVSLEIASRPEEKKITFAVRDNGIGIKPEFVHLLFRPFQQIDAGLSREYSGTGLGLAIVKKMVQLHEGSVTVESEPGKGSCFTVTIPLREPSLPGGMAEKTDSRPGIPGMSAATNNQTGMPGSPLILIAEDNQINSRIFQDYLKASGYQIAVAFDGLEALNSAKKFKPDAILMDIQMPGLDGLEAIRQIRQLPEHRSTPIIAVTALAMTGDKDNCLNAGADGYLAKPVTLKHLRTELENWIKKKKRQ